METTMILPVLDTKKLQDKANEYAMQGAIKTIEEYYSGYNSPFRKIIEEELKKTSIGRGNIELPDIIALINGSLSKEIDMVANTAISKTFVPMVQRFLTRENKEMKFSEILKDIIDEGDSKEYDDYTVEAVKNDRYGWFDVSLSVKDKEYKMTFHEDYESKKSHELDKKNVIKYHILSLPDTSYDMRSKQTMKISVDGVSLEMPFTTDVLHDNVMSFIARLVVANTKITMDCYEFSEDMFPQDECHC
jgi:hypothetical protein